jgi:hypothetical protein
MRLLSKLVMCACALMTLVPFQTFALSQDQINTYNSGINFFDVATNEEGSAGGASCLSGNDNETKVWNYLVAKNLSAVQAAGIMGNLKAESGFEPKRVEDGWGFPTTMDSIPPNVGPRGQPGYGIAQWTTPSRKAGLSDLASKENLAVYDLGLQLDYLWQEFTTSYKDTYSQISQSGDIKFVSDTFGRDYEGFGTNTADLRLSFAPGILTQYGSDTSGGIASCDTSTGVIQIDPNFKMIKLNPPLSSPGGQITPKGVTLHWWGSDSGSQGIKFLVSALRSNDSCGVGGCSVQIGITDDGKIYQMTKNLTDLTYHAAGGNQTTFGIEIEGAPSDFGAAGVSKYPQKFAAVVATVKYLVATYKLPLTGPATCDDVSGVHPHKDYNQCLLNGSPQNKIDIDDTYFNEVMQKVRQ